MSKLKLGAFSISLNVKDIHLSKAFYEKLGFEVTGGNIDQKWLILKNESTVIGLFQGMFPANILTFNPGWDQNAAMLEDFTDVREIEKHLLEQELSLNETTKSENGPAYITLTDPDGNSILIDQHR
jgi:lactoylglutathione lyase